MPDEAPLAASPRLAAPLFRSVSGWLRSPPWPRRGLQLPDQRPVEQVSWLQAIEFCRRLAAITGDAPLLLDGDEAAGWR